MEKKCFLSKGFLVLMVCCVMAVNLHGFEVKAASASLKRGEEVFYDGYSTFYYYIDGKLGYCLEPKKNSPHDGEFTANLLSHDTLLSKALYYMYGGPGYDAYMKPELKNGYEEQSMAYCLSHCVLSYVYDNCNGNSDAFQGLSENMKTQVIECVRKIKSFPSVPEPDLEFSKSKVVAYFSTEEGVQRTEEIVCSGDTRNYVELTLPKGMTLVNVTKGSRVDGKVRIYGQDHFYLCADAGVYNGESWKSGDVYGVNCQKWRSLVISTGSEGQHLGTGSLVTAEAAPVSLEVEWLPKPELEVDKYADKTDKIFKVGDIITYSIDVTQQIERAVAKNVVITDTILTEGVKLQKNSIVLLDKNQSVISDAVISVKGNSYTIQAGKFLQGVETGEKYTVEYQVAITDAEVIGKEIENKVIVYADNAEEEEDDEKVTVEEPKESKEPKKPEEPKEPEKPEEPEKPKEEPKSVKTEKVESVKTGDEQEWMLLAVLMILSCTGIFVCGRIAHNTK